jgi:hypothetical protein
MDYNNNQHKTKKMSHHLVHNNKQGNKENIIDVVLLTRLEANGPTKY